jgi:hypothetical protein
MCSEEVNKPFPITEPDCTGIVGNLRKRRGARVGGINAWRRKGIWRRYTPQLVTLVYYATIATFYGSDCMRMCV